MNEELQRELKLWLTSLRDHAGRAEDFVLEQAPLVVREYVLLGRVESLLTVLALAIAVYGLARLCHWGVKQSGDHVYGDAAAPACILGGAGVILAGICLICSIHWAVVAWFAPRIYVLDYLVGLVKGNG